MNLIDFLLHFGSIKGKNVNQFGITLLVLNGYRRSLSYSGFIRFNLSLPKIVSGISGISGNRCFCETGFSLKTTKKSVRFILGREGSDGENHSIVGFDDWYHLGRAKTGCAHR